VHFSVVTASLAYAAVLDTVMICFPGFLWLNILLSVV